MRESTRKCINEHSHLNENFNTTSSNGMQMGMKITMFKAFCLPEKMVKLLAPVHFEAEQSKEISSGGDCNGFGFVQMNVEKGIYKTGGQSFGRSLKISMLSLQSPMR